MGLQQNRITLERFAELEGEFIELFEPAKPLFELGEVQIMEKFPEIIYSNTPASLGATLFAQRLRERSHLSSWNQAYYDAEIELAQAVASPGVPVFNENFEFIDPSILESTNAVPLYIYAYDDKGPCAVLQANSLIEELPDGSVLVDLNVASVMVSADRRQQGIAKELVQNLVCDFVWKLDCALQASKASRVAVRVNVNQDTRAGKIIFEMVMAWLIEELDLQPRAYPGGISFHSHLNECPLMIVNSELPIKVLLGLSEE